MGLFWETSGGLSVDHTRTVMSDAGLRTSPSLKAFRAEGDKQGSVGLR